MELYVRGVPLEDYEEEDYYDYECEDSIYGGFEITEVDGCCAAYNFYDFPEYDHMNDDELVRLEEDLKHQIRDQKNHRCIIIFTNDNQPQTNHILNKLGFKHTRWMNKPRHDDDTRIRLWWWEPDRREEAYKWE